MADTQQIEKIINTHKGLDLSSVINYEKFKLYSIVTGSTALEGSTLTEIDTQLLLDEGITSKGKPLEHHLMVKDNYAAMKEALRLARLQTPITPEVLKTLNGLNMKHTGQVVNAPLGTVDGTTGVFRKVQAMSDALGYYLAPTKISSAVDKFCKNLQQQMSNDLSSSAALDLSFGAQAYLITKIHPWQDGNKRTSRLLSSYIQQYYDLPLGKLDKEDSGEYLQHLKTFKYDDDVAPFIGFMRDKYVVLLQQEIVAYQKAHEQKDLQKAVPSAALRAVNALVDARAPAPVAQHRRQQGLS